MGDTTSSIERGHAYLDRDHGYHERIYRQKESSTGTGETGERGEEPRQQRDSSQANKGESGRSPDDAKRGKALERARKLLLTPATDAPRDYPVAALGPMAEACETVATEGQMARSMAGQCLLSAAALLTQSQANVQTMAGVKPLSLYLQTVADSGEGKSTAEDVALGAVRAWQREQHNAFALAQEQAEQEAATRKRGDPRPTPPREPYRIMRDATVEGIRRSFRQGAPSQGVFTSEAAAMLAGYGMNADNRAKSAGNFNSLWDDGELSVARGLDGRIQLYDRRLSVHWLVQADVARHALHDPMLSSMGFWPRFLIDWPAPSAPMQARPFHADRHASIADFWRRCRLLLEPPLGEDCHGLPTIVATDEAQDLAGRFFERMQVAAKTSGGKLEAIKPFAIRATEQVFRVAGVLSAFTGGRTIDTAAMRDGIALVAHSLEVWRGIFGDRDEAEARANALKLYEWLLRQPEQAASETAILRIGPKALRTQHRRDTALAILEQYRLATRSRDRWNAQVTDQT